MRKQVIKENNNIADDEWEWYIGSLFSRLINFTYKSNINCVVELGPGYRHKIANALQNINFQGTLYVIDSNLEVLEYVKDAYKKFIPKATIICINKDFEDAFDDIPQNFDLFLSNHCIDDLIISKYMHSYYNKNLGNDKFKDMLINAWQSLGKDPVKINTITNDIYSLFERFFKNKNIGTIIMSQYKSNAYFVEKFKEMDDITYNCFKEIKKLIMMNDSRINKVLNFYPFGNDERYRGKYLINNTQNAKNWIVGTCMK